MESKCSNKIISQLKNNRMIGEFIDSVNEMEADEMENLLHSYDKWSSKDQVNFVKILIRKMSQSQHEVINSFLKPILQRDFISLLPKYYLDHISEKILSYLDAHSLARSELVCKEWHRIISESLLWKKFIEYNVMTDNLWKGLSNMRGWDQFLFKNKISPDTQNNKFYRNLYPKILKDIQNLEKNWKSGKNILRKIECKSEASKGVYCLQYDKKKIVSGLRDNTIKVWDIKNLECTKVLKGHGGSVLCLQYDDKIIITGSSDSTVRIWDITTGENIKILRHHTEAVLHLRFQHNIMVTCSKDRHIAVWNIASLPYTLVKRTLVGHRAAVNVVDFDSRYIVSASGDRTIKVWDTNSCEYIRTLNGHKRGIACLQYRDKLIVSGSSDYTIKLWDIESGNCLRTLDGHEELVRCIRFDTKRIVSGAYDGKIMVWDLEAALDPRSPPGSICIQTFHEHTGRVFRLQFDDFQIISSSHDDTILIWDFLNYESPESVQNEEMNIVLNAASSSLQPSSLLFSS